MSVAGALIALTIVTAIVGTYSASKEQAEAARAESRRKEDAAKLAADRAGKERERLASMSPEQREAEEKQKKAESKAAEERAIAPIIHDGEAMLTRWREREAWAKASLAGKTLKEPLSKPVMKQEWEGIKTRLSSIKQSQPYYQKAQEILASMAEEDK